MGQSEGAGSPLFFNCPVWRRADWRNRSHLARFHEITVGPGRKPAKTNAFSRPGVRSTPVRREWSCSCGASGWSSHLDLARKAGEAPRARIEDLRPPG